jgi:hypothetical protein
MNDHVDGTSFERLDPETGRPIYVIDMKLDDEGDMYLPPTTADVVLLLVLGGLLGAGLTSLAWAVVTAALR